jgi:hypothetical protein
MADQSFPRPYLVSLPSASGSDEPRPEVQIEARGHVDAPALVLANGQTLHRRYTVTVDEAGVEYVDDIEEWVE